MSSSYVDLEAFRATPLTREPFEFLAVPGFLNAEACAEINRDYPKIAESGSFPVAQLAFGPAFQKLLDELAGEDFRKAFADKFAVDLTGRPHTITVRGRCAAKDGRIHTDTETKLITVLIYFNDLWEAKGGRLRLLRSPTDLNDMIGEVSPELGAMVAFRRSDKSYHGHDPFEGVRRYVMINWMTSDAAARRELFRHRVSARAKFALSLLKPRSARKAGGARA